MLDAIGPLDCTTIFITHRLAVAQRADTVVVIDEGRVVETGHPRRADQRGRRVQRAVAVGTEVEGTRTITEPDGGRSRSRRSRAGSLILVVMAGTRVPSTDEARKRQFDRLGWVVVSRMVDVMVRCAGRPGGVRSELVGLVPGPDILLGAVAISQWSAVRVAWFPSACQIRRGSNALWCGLAPVDGREPVFPRRGRGRVFVMWLALSDGPLRALLPCMMMLSRSSQRPAASHPAVEPTLDDPVLERTVDDGSPAGGARRPVSRPPSIEARGRPRAAPSGLVLGDLVESTEFVRAGPNVLETRFAAAIVRLRRPPCMKRLSARPMQ